MKLAVKKNPETIEQKLIFISRRIFLSVFVLGILSWIASEIIHSLKLEWGWLEVVFGILFLLGALALVISWITPGLLIVLGKPKFVHAWLRGINPIAIPSSPWDELSNSEKLFVYMNAMILSGVTLFAIVGFTFFLYARV